MVTKPIQIKEQTYLKEYKNIIKTCISDGEILPGLLEVIEVPPKYDFTDSEIEKMKISKESSSLRQQRRSELESRLGEIHYNGSFDEMNNQLNIIYNEELMGFIGRHPEYQKIIK